MKIKALFQTNLRKDDTVAAKAKHTSEIHTNDNESFISGLI